jgi:16S rRNA (guanine966-N2)-methyltransferase
VTRIIGGSVGGRVLRTPAGWGTRPTSDRVREALFSSIQASEGPLEGTTFLDVYAGSGAVGLEARSRGAVAVTLVESDRTVTALVRANASALRLDGITVICSRAERLDAQPRPVSGFDIAFLDPPYELPSADLASVVCRLRAARWFADHALVVVERSSRDEPWVWPDGLDGLRERGYGETTLWYGRNGRRDQADGRPPDGGDDASQEVG